MVNFKKVFLLFFLSFAIMISVVPNIYALMLIVEDGQLMGADDVIVDGNPYDVRFVDGTASALFYSDGSWNFTFGVSSEDQIYNALFQDVFVGDYDIDPERTNGIEYESWGYILTPIGFSLGGDVLCATVINLHDDLIDVRTQNQAFDPTESDTANMPGFVYAVWTPSAPVPEPSSLLLLGTGILGLVGAMRKKFKH